MARIDTHPDESCVIYRIFARDDGTLLYIGCTRNLRQRMYAHNSFRFPRDLVRVAAEKPMPRWMAEDRERRLIGRHKPPFNFLGNDWFTENWSPASGQLPWSPMTFTVREWMADRDAALSGG